MQNSVRGPLGEYLDGLHQATTTRSTVTGIHINVLTPEAVRAVIGVAVAHYVCTTIFTHEIFSVSSKRCAHVCIVAQLYCVQPQAHLPVWGIGAPHRLLRLRG